MRISRKMLMPSVLVVFSMLAWFGLTNTVLAASTPDLGLSDSFAILSSTYTNTVSGTTITGDLGYTTPPAVAPTVNGTTHMADATYDQAGLDQAAALAALNAEPCDFNYGSATNLSLLSQPLVPGVYCITGAATVGTAGITLNGSGTYLFRIDGALGTVADSVVSLTGGASACNVFWTPTAATTLGANSTFVGTDIDASGITIGSTVTWTGRALAFGGTVSTDTDTIVAPICLANASANLHVIKQVVRDNGSTALSSDFTLHVTFAGDDVTGSPAVGIAAPGRYYFLPAGTYVVSEDANSAYTSTYSGDCGPGGVVSLAQGDDKTCTITNDDIPATLRVIKEVINDNGGIATPALFNLHVKLAGTDVTGSPASGTATPGTTYTLNAGTYIVSEDANSSYTQTFSEDCNSSGSVTLSVGEVKTCTIINNDIAGLVDTGQDLVDTGQILTRNAAILGGFFLVISTSLLAVLRKRTI